MDYVFVIFFAAFAALVYSVFTSFIASRSGRPIYRKIMWTYLAILAIAAIVITVMQLPSEWLAFGSLLTAVPFVFLQLAIAVKLGHLTMKDAQYSRANYGMPSTPADEYTNSWKQIYHGMNDPHRR